MDPPTEGPTVTAGDAFLKATLTERLPEGRERYNGGGLFLYLYSRKQTFRRSPDEVVSVVGYV